MQKLYPYDRSHYSGYNSVLAHFQARSVMENMRGDTILDLACGDGTITGILSSRCKRIVGVDVSSHHLAAAKKKCPEGEFHESLIENFLLPERFETVILINILEHVVDPVETLDKAASFLAKDGIVIVQVPNAMAINRRIARIMGTLHDEYELSPYDISIAGHRRSYDIDSLSGDITAAGLTIESSGGIFYKMLSTPQMDWFLENGLWEGNEFGWGRVGGGKKDWKKEFCRACYEIGKERPEDCNIIYACATREDGP